MQRSDASKMTICCLNPDCSNPLNPDGEKFCLTCSAPLVVLLRNRFRVIRVLSDEGGFGRTYLAEDIDKLNELCVIKQLAPKAEGSWALKKAIELFQKEAKRLQELGEHPQIPTLLAYFEQDSYLYLVQQFIDGQNLLRELDTRRRGKTNQSPYTEGEIQEILLNLLPVLKFVHEHGVIHRDIKPQNIMLRKSDQRLNLIDFGSSKQFTVRVQSKTGTSIGSHGYSPIEQIRDGVAYPASDLFSLGATCFHLLTGISPFQLWTEHGYAWVNCWQQYLKSPISDQFTQILNKLLKKDLHQRYQSADDVLRDLGYKSPVPVKINSLPVLNKKGVKLQIAIVAGAGILLLVMGEFWYKQFDSFGNNNPSNLSQPNPDTIGIDLSSKGFIPDYSLAVTIRGYTNTVLSVLVTPDGKTIASNNQNTIKLWSLLTGQEVATFDGHTKQVNAIAISNDGKILVSGGDDNVVKLWTMANGKELATLGGHSQPIRAVAISPDSKIVADGSDDATIKLWDLGSRREIVTLMGHTSSVHAIAFSPDGNILASAGVDKTVKLWNVSTGQIITTLTGHEDTINSLAFSPDGKTLATASGDKTVKLWNLEKKQLIRTLTGHTAGVTSVAFNPDEMTLTTASSDRTIKLWNFLTGRTIRTLTSHTGAVESIGLNRDASTLVSGSEDKTLRIWRRTK
ncbi:serine/threonine protein kinase with WD40 repeats [Calothrix sp. PCC 6303]|nr:serine/threonine protein kinase with WD40 repeats [Calothrix sp. PCC 6303]